MVNRQKKELSILEFQTKTRDKTLTPAELLAKFDQCTIQDSWASRPLPQIREAIQLLNPRFTSADLGRLIAIGLRTRANCPSEYLIEANQINFELSKIISARGLEVAGIQLRSVNKATRSFRP